MITVALPLFTFMMTMFLSFANSFKGASSSIVSLALGDLAFFSILNVSGRNQKMQTALRFGSGYIFALFLAFIDS